MSYTLLCVCCGKKVQRKYKLKRTKCAECHRKRSLEDRNEKHEKKRVAKRIENPVAVVTSPCYTCQYYARCKRDLWRVADVPGDGMVIVPFKCFADHAHYDPKEWRQRV